MSDTVKVYVAVCIENVIITICFTILAVIFGKWWIVLFSCLCYTKVKRSVTYNENK